MDNICTLTLAAFSGRENPTVSISELEFNSILSSIKSSGARLNYLFIPGLGDVGFILRCQGTTIELYREHSTIKINSNAMNYSTRSDIIKKVFDLFFRFYTDKDYVILKSLAMNRLYGG